MKQSIGFCQFTAAFRDMNRENNFSYRGLIALFNYLEELGDDMGEEIELDVIALCCEFTEYENIEEFVAQYGAKYIVWDTEPEEADEEEDIDYEATLDKIRDYTQVIDIDGESFIIQDF